MLKKQILILVCMFVAMGGAQKTETHKLLQQASEMVFYNPKEAFTIAEHSSSLTNDSHQKAEAYFILAVASYLMGQYEEALGHAFELRELAKKEKNQEMDKRSIALIHRLFFRLQLSDYQSDFTLKNFLKYDLFQTEDLLSKVQYHLGQQQIDSAFLYINQTEALLNLENPGYFEAIYYGVKGDLFFENKDFENALLFYQKADSLGTKLENPFLSSEIYNKLAANYLALDDVVEYQRVNELVKQLTTKSSEVENKAYNQAYSLMTDFLDDDLKRKKKIYSSVLVLLICSVVFGFLLKIIFDIRNKNKEKTLSRMLSYLRNHKIKLQQLETEALKTTSQLEESTDEPKQTFEFNETKSKKEENYSKSGVLLKESENQILVGLSKFENSTRFTQKDMSLGKLAARLNTNTKYLSEVINRHKEKNFNAYINELRINYIIAKLKSDSTYLNYKVSYLADECGFSSHSSFTTVFKSIVGVSPSVFIEFVREESEKVKGTV